MAGRTRRADTWDFDAARRGADSRPPEGALREFLTRFAPQSRVAPIYNSGLSEVGRPPRSGVRGRSGAGSARDRWMDVFGCPAPVVRAVGAEAPACAVTPMGSTQPIFFLWQQTIWSFRNSLRARSRGWAMK